MIILLQGFYSNLEIKYIFLTQNIFAKHVGMVNWNLSNMLGIKGFNWNMAAHIN